MLKTYSKHFSKLLCTLLIFLSITNATLNLGSIASKLNLQALGTVTIADTETTSEAKNLDINQVYFDTTSGYKFGDRINTQNQTPISKDDIKNEPCGKKFDQVNPLDKFDTKTKATVIKTIKTTCADKNGSISKNKQSWLKLLWDNGLIGWVRNPSEKVATVSNLAGNSTISQNLFWNNILRLAVAESISVSATTNSNTKTCKDFSYQVRDLRVLNQYPNLDLNDNGVGCEHLPLDPTDSFATTSYSNIQVYDKTKDDKITCADFESQVVDVEILAMFPRLDDDKDGIGCESNPTQVNITKTGNYAEEGDITAPDTELNVSGDVNSIQANLDWSGLGLNLSNAFQKDYQYLFQANGDCNTFDIGCRAINSIAGLGRQGLWLFNLVRGLLQGAGQSIVDLLKLVWDLVSNPGDTITKIIDSFKQLINNTELVAKAFFDQVSDLLKAETQDRAYKVGVIIGGIIPDIIIGTITAGVGAIGLKALQNLKTSQNITSKVISIGKFVSKSVKIISDIPTFTLSKVSQGVGILGGQIMKLIRTLDDTAFGKLMSIVKNEGDRVVLQRIRFLLSTARLHDSKLIRYSQSTAQEIFSDKSGTITGLSENLAKGTVKPQDIKPIQVVRMEDGILTSLDNRRLVSTSRIGSKVSIVERGFNEVLTSDEIARFTKKGYPTPKTWSDATKVRINSQTPKDWFKGTPNGSFKEPKIKY